MSEVTKFKNPNLPAIQHLFKRACHAVSSRSPVEMSDPANVSRLLGELFAAMHEEEQQWHSELRACKGWVCDLPAKLGGGTASLTALDAKCSRLLVAANSKWSTERALEISAADRAELEKIMAKFVQLGSLVELAGADAAADPTRQQSTAAAATTRISLMREAKQPMRVFTVAETSDTRKVMSAILETAQRIDQAQRAGLASGQVAMMAF